MVEKSPFGPIEEAIWQYEFQGLVQSYFQFREFATIYMVNRDWLHDLALAAKNEFSETFYGSLAQSGFGWRVLRPEDFTRLTTDAGVTHTSWLRTVAAAGWNDWIATAAARNQLSRDAYVGLIGLGNLAPDPVSVAVHFAIEGVTDPPMEYEWAVRNGLKLWDLPQNHGISPRRSFNFRLKDRTTGSDEPFFLGIAYCRANYLGQETPHLEAP